MPAPPLESLPAMVSATRIGTTGQRAPRRGAGLAEHEQELKRRHVSREMQLRPAAVGAADHRFGSTRSSAAGPGTAASRQ